jgi:hypothetical protein
MATQQDTGVSHTSRRRYWREADARLVVEAWRQSGLSMAEYAKRHGVHAKRLSRWAQRLQASPPDSLTFLPVKLRRQPMGQEIGSAVGLTESGPRSEPSGNDGLAGALGSAKYSQTAKH